MRVYASPEPVPAADEVLADQPQPDPRAVDRETAEARGQQIIERLQAGARAVKRPELGSDELAMVLEAVTNLPEDVIDRLTQSAVAGSQSREGASAARLAGESFPINVTGAVKAAAAREAEGAARAPAQVASPDLPASHGPAL